MSLRKTAPKEAPHATFENSTGWTWRVLKTYQKPANDSKQFSRWFCFVTSPYCPEGEYGDTYVRDIVGTARITRSTREFADAYAGKLGIQGVALIAEAA